MLLNRGGELKILGFVFGDKPTVKPHVEYMLKKAKKRELKDFFPQQFVETVLLVVYLIERQNHNFVVFLHKAGLDPAGAGESRRLRLINVRDGESERLLHEAFRSSEPVDGLQETAGIIPTQRSRRITTNFPRLLATTAPTYQGILSDLEARLSPV